jgi:hypothetical protein
MDGDREPHLLVAAQLHCRDLLTEIDRPKVISLGWAQAKMPSASKISFLAKDHTAFAC